MTKRSRYSAASRREESARKKDRFFLTLGIGLSLLGALGLGVVAIVLQKSGAPPDPDASTPIIAPDYPRHLVDFSLIDQSGRPVTRKDLDGKIVVVNFVFTSCSVICPYVNAQMEKIQKHTAARPDVRLLSLSMDPVDDTAPVLASYGRTFGQDVSRWSFVTGNESELRRLVGASFLPPDTTGEFAYMPGNFAHTQRIALVDAQGRLVEYFDGLNQEASDAVDAAIDQMKPSPP